MNLTAADNRTATELGYCHFTYNTYPSPQRLLQQLHGYEWRCGDGVSVVHEITVPHRVELIWPRTQAPCPVRLSAAVKFISYRGIEAENVHFQPSAWGFLTTKHSRRFANDVALALREKIPAGMDFRVANRLWADYVGNLGVQPWLRLRTLKTRTSRNGKISSKRHKNTPEVSHVYSFYWMNVKLSIF